ncbi:MAG TPA: tetratricopeptide repeat protein, partial [Vicinamibacterales bacterium]|nr:tetratricopeptide repeat protein [Vicinamibacterales bacterium]
ALDRELFDYIRAYLFNAILFDFGEKVAGQTVQKGQTIADADAAVYLGDLQGRVGRLEESRTRLAAVLKQNPNAARAHASLGMQEFRANQIDKALPLLERAAALGTNDGWVQNAYGRVLIARLGEGTADSTATVQQARTVLARAVELDPESPFAAAMLGYVELILDSEPARAVPLLERAVKLAPSREQYRVFLAQAYLRQREFTKASNQLGPLVASARSPQIREQARDLLGRLVTMQQRAAAPAAAPTAEQLASLAALSRSAESTAPPADRARTPSRPGPTVRLDLRPVGANETRVRGTFSAVECAAGAIVLVVQTDSGPVRLRAKQLSDVDFVSYRTDTPGRVECGTMAAPQPVLATYRSAPQGTGASSTAGDATAIELVPDDYILR